MKTVVIMKLNNRIPANIERKKNDSFSKRYFLGTLKIDKHKT